MPRRPRPSFADWSGVAYRATSYDVPLAVNPNRRSGRWNLAGEGCVQYLCLDAEAPMAEMLRGEDLRSDAEAVHYTTTVWQLRVDEGAVVDYRTFERAAKAGFPPDALVDDDHERCRAEARWLVERGARGLLSPSAALPGSVNLTLFGPRVPIAWAATTRLASAIPVQRLVTGHPPAGLVARVRFYGEPHAGLLAHQASRAPGVTEPGPSRRTR
jgi:RES domain-containing protein